MVDLGSWADLFDGVRDDLQGGGVEFLPGSGGEHGFPFAMNVNQHILLGMRAAATAEFGDAVFGGL